MTINLSTILNIFSVVLLSEFLSHPRYYKIILIICSGICKFYKLIIRGTIEGAYTKGIIIAISIGLEIMFVYAFLIAFIVMGVAFAVYLLIGNCVTLGSNYHFTCQHNYTTLKQI
ncbi:hypothetical protein AAHE18_09G020900 [Arachis hypogaea]